jgi:hypothetical protein
VPLPCTHLRGPFFDAEKGANTDEAALAKPTVVSMAKPGFSRNIGSHAPRARTSRDNISSGIKTTNRCEWIQCLSFHLNPVRCFSTTKRFRRFCPSMHLLRNASLILGTACFCIANSLDTVSSSLEPRGWVNVFGKPKIPKDPQTPAAPPRPPTKPQDEPQIGGGTAGEAADVGISGYANGRAAHHTSPFGENAKESVQEVAKAALDGFRDVVTNIWGGPAPSATPTSTVTSIPTRSLQALLAEATADNADDLTYYAVADLGLPSFDNAQTLLEQGILANWTYMLTPAEYSMYQESPLCYFANIETMYIDASLDQPADQTGAEKFKRSDGARQATDDILQRDDSPERDAYLRDMYAEMFEDVLPYHILYMHMAEPTVKGSATAVVVSTTSCAGLDGIHNGVGVATSYRKLEVVQTPVPVTEENGNAKAPATVGSTSSAPQRITSRIVLVFVMGAMLGVWV